MAFAPSLNEKFCTFVNLFFQFIAVPRKVLRESYDAPLESDEQSQLEPTFENELDEDDHMFKAIPPAPKLQGTIPRNDSNTTQNMKQNTEADLTLIENQKSFAEGMYRTE